MNLTKAVVRLRTQLIAAVNEAGLPPVVVGFVLAELQNEITRLTAEELKKEEKDDGTAEHSDAK